MKTRAIFSTALLFALFFVVTGFAQDADLSGRWAGQMTTSLSGAGGLEMDLARDGEKWKVSLKVRIGGQEITSSVKSLKVDGSQIFCVAVIDRTQIRFTGKADGDKLSGTLEAFQEERKISDGTFSLTRNGQMPALQQTSGMQVADPNFDAKVAKATYAKNGPKVLFDEAHNNFHTTTGRYKPFADLIRNDGYQITPNAQKFSRETLKPYRILVIANALGHARMGAAEASNSAFSEEESDAVRDWVKGGGSLLLIADHAPMGAANQSLAQRFAVDMSKGYTSDPENYEKDTENRGFIVYTRESGRLADHAITRGRSASEQLNKIIAFTGQSLKGPADSVAFMKLADTAEDRMPASNNPPTSAAGRAQGVAMKFGKGRVIVLGEAAMLSAQLITGPNEMRFGMNRPGIDNRQLALNIMHWLSGVLK